MSSIGPVVSEKMFEIVDGRTDDRRLSDWYTISSPMSFGSGELKSQQDKFDKFISPKEGLFERNISQNINPIYLALSSPLVLFRS